ncbi:DUF1264-domain-containing protein [Bimuria novae-zelandiae CBS 107.79]|uniref:DUF1264-domain-containing protein n=1 Tax=Bimuria novae-zelandiae CBS 107.79 TaxID=1447943 RepID=A0A6A5VFK4_9PLEO|nr:DUF1264-domain-containing protein [Bimuria novae-zelandiae CBS 107.79]
MQSWKALRAVAVQLLALAGAVSSDTTSPPNQFGLIGPSSVMLFLNGFHFISGHLDQILHANYHCSIMSADFIQCAVYVPGTNPARLAGVEYIISGPAFEKYEVTSGLLVEPGMSGNVDKEVMKLLVNTHGKTFHTWRYASKNNSIPLGIPEIVNGYTANGQLDDTYVGNRDEIFGLNHTAIRENRSDIVAPPVVDGADSWKRGFV